MEDTLEWMILSQIPGVGPTGFWQLVQFFGSPTAVLQSSSKKLENLPGIRKSHLNGFEKRDSIRQRCLRQLERLEKMGAVCLTCEDTDYPRYLSEIKDPPPVLYLLGDRTLLNNCCIGVVGSRAATSYGHRTSFLVSKKLAERDVTIVSGLALGIDTEAHKGALSAKGKTIAILGCGLDIVYPRQNKTLFAKICTEGAVVTENILGTAPEGFRFPARNRIIAGMSRGVLVVEAARKSGSLITAQIALDEGRDVFAVPGQVDSFKSEGTHWLLKQGAKLVQSESDILEELPGYSAVAGHKVGGEDDGSAFLDENAQKLLNCLDAYPCQRDELIGKSGLTLPELSESLLVLELEGYIEILPGNEIRRIAR